MDIFLTIPKPWIVCLIRSVIFQCCIERIRHKMVWSDVLCHSLCICLSELLFITDYKSIIQRIQKTARCDCLVFLVGNAILYGLLLVKCVWKTRTRHHVFGWKKMIIRLNASLIKWKWLLLFKHLFVRFFWQIDKPMISKRTRRRENMFAIGADLFSKSV